MKKTLLMMAGALVLGASSLTSCGGSKADIRVWCASEDVSFVNTVIEKFKTDNAEFKDKSIKVVVTSEADAATAIKEDPKASADVFHFAGDQIGTLVRGDLLYEFSSKQVESLGVDPNVLAGGRVNGKQYGIPFTPNTYFLYYDASVYTEEQVKSLNKMLEVTLPSGYTHHLSLDICNGWYLQSYFFSNGCTIYGSDGTDGTKGIQPLDKASHVAKWVYDYYKGAHSKTLYAGDGSAEVGVTIAAGVTGTWNADTIKTHIESHGGTYAAAPLPKVDFGDGEVEWKAVADYKQIGVNKSTNSPELACRFAAYLANTNSQKLRYEMRKTAPTDQTAAEQIENVDAAVVAQTEQLKYTFNQPTIYADTGYWDAATAFGSDISQASSELDVQDYFDSFLNRITLTAE